MLNYNVARCLSCDDLINIWVGIGLAERQPMVFMCPECDSELHMTLTVDYSKVSHNIESDDIEIIDEERDETRKGVNLYADLPVRKDKQGLSLANGGSAFLELHRQMGSDIFEEFNIFKNHIHALYDISFHIIRRTKNFYFIGNYKALSKQLSKIKVLKFKGNDKHKVIGHYHSLLANFSLPGFMDKIFNGAFSDVLKNLATCIKNHRTDCDNLLNSYWTKYSYANFSKRLIELFIRYLEKFDAIILGVAYSGLTKKGANLNDYVIFRSDFNELKSIYVDAYELAIQGLLYIAPIYNLSARGNIEQWSNGEKESLTNFSKRMSSKKEFAFTDEPALNDIYSALNRNLRNKIGHNDLIFDMKSQTISLGKNDTILLADFFDSFINAYKVLTFLLCIERIMKLKHYK